jgi:hypothetical protein
MNCTRATKLIAEPACLMLLTANHSSLSAALKEDMTMPVDTKGLRSSVDPMTEYVVETACGRRMDRRAFDYESLIRDLHFNGLTPTFIQPLTEYEADVRNKEEQERLNDEISRAIDEGMKRSA